MVRGQAIGTCLAGLAAAAVIMGSAHAQPATVAGGALSPAERATIIQVLAGEIGEAPPGMLDDAVLRGAVVRYATEQLGQRIRPAGVNRLWAMAPPVRNVEAEFQAARTAGALRTWLQHLTPVDWRYRALSGYRCVYASIVDRGGWAKLPSSPTLRAGMRDPAVRALRARLLVEGYLAEDNGAEDLFDEAVDKALQSFQAHHGLKPDGVLGRAVRAALDVPAETRLQQIEANLERWRWVPKLSDDRIEVDVGGAQATLYQAGAKRLTMRAVVGDRRHQTPIFVSALDGVVFNPPWNVPASITAQELLPKEAASSGYLARNGFRWVGGALQQQPGPANALGRVKFEMASAFGVYLHDTPGQAAFLRDDRHLSHGCVRLENPRALAAILLAPQGWDAARIDAAIGAGATARQALVQATPVLVFYWTAAVDGAGGLDFRPDPYGWDRQLNFALLSASRPPVARR